MEVRSVGWIRREDKDHSLYNFPPPTLFFIVPFLKYEVIILKPNGCLPQIGAAAKEFDSVNWASLEGCIEGVREWLRRYQIEISPQ